MPLRTDGLSLDELATDPITGLVAGDMWYNSTDAKLKYFDGNDIIVLPGTLSPDRTIMVAKGGTDYSTVEAGITAAIALTPTATNPVAILVYPGLYTEVALTLPEYVSLIGVGYAGSTILTPSVVDQAFLTLSGSQVLNGLLFSGATGSDGIAVQLLTASKEATLIGCSVTNCQTGFLVGAAGAVMNCSICGADGRNANYVETAFYCQGGASMNVVGGQVTGDGTTLVSYGYRCENNGSRLKLKGSYANYASRGVYAADSGVIEGSSGECDDCTVAVALDSTTATTEVSLSSYELNRSTNLDIDCGASTDGILNFSGIADEEKISIPDAFSNYVLSFLNRDEIHRGQQILGTLSVGSKDHSQKSYLGSGAPYFKGVVVLSNDAGTTGTWVDNTEAARSKSGSTFQLFQSTVVNNCAYFGADEPFSGLEYGIVTALDPGPTGLVIGEYWNGTAWSQFRTMSYEPVYPYDQYGVAAFMRISEHEHMNFESVFEDMAPLLLNGYTKYWARVRIVTAITTVPVAEYARALPSSLYVDPYGTPLRTGYSRKVQTIPWHRNVMDPGTGATPTSVDISVSTNISLDADTVSFNNNTVDAKGGTVLIPEGIDTSNPLILTVSWYCTVATGNVALRLYHVTIKNGMLVNGTVADTLNTYIFPVPTTANTLAVSSAPIPIYDAVPGNLKAILIERDATAGNPDDTAEGSVVLVDASLSATFWR